MEEVIAKKSKKNSELYKLILDDYQLSEIEKGLKQLERQRAASRKNNDKRKGSGVTSKRITRQINIIRQE